jgi:chromosome partitioning protein
MTSRWDHRTTARVIAVANRKGGVAKTTTTINLGRALADRGRRVLLVDLDAQQDLCSALRVPIPRPGLADVLLSMALFETARLSDAFVELHGMTIAGGCGIGGAEQQLVTHGNTESALKSALAPHLHRFDYVLLDCPPSVNCLTAMALTAAREVLIPIQTEFLAANQLPGIMSAVDDIRSRLNPRLKVAGFLPTLYDSRTRHALGIIEQIALQGYLWGVQVFKPIPKAIRLAEAAQAGQPVSLYAPDSLPARAYAGLAAEIDRSYDGQTALSAVSFFEPCAARVDISATVA